MTVLCKGPLETTTLSIGWVENPNEQPLQIAVSGYESLLTVTKNH